MSTITTLANTNTGAASMTTINTNFANLNTDKQEKGSGVTGNLIAFGASNVLADSGKVAPSGVVVGTTDTQTLTNKNITAPTISAPTLTGVLTNNGSYAGSAVLPIANGGTGQVTQQAAIDALLPSQGGNANKVISTNGTTSSWVTAAQVRFGGTGSDGALTVSSGTTTIDLSNAAVVVKNYTSISITGTGAVAFINPNSTGTVVIFKSQGAVTLTSSATPMLDASGLGAAGAASVVSGGANLAGTNGTAGAAYYLFSTGAGIGAATSAVGAGGAKPTTQSAVPIQLATGIIDILRYGSQFSPGAGGASGQTTSTGTSGAGGNGGGVFILECAGAFNFTTASGISVAGKAGGNGGTNVGAGGGGGGGIFFCLYNTLTANSGTVTVSGGTGGNAGTNSYSSGGGASFINAGASPAGGLATAGGAGGAGYSFITANTLYS